jgi:CO/xanthine dehydrogenase Mo-binding subunit
MTPFDNPGAFSRRSILKAVGALVVSVGMPVSLETVLSINAGAAQGVKPPLLPSELDSFIAINTDGSVSAYFGKMDMGQGLFTAIGQIVAEELDVPFNQVTVIMGDTATSVNQGGASGSTGVQNGGKQMRAAAAEARRILTEMAAAKLGAPPDKLIVVDGIVRVLGDQDAARTVAYADLIGGRYFNTQLAWNKQFGNNLFAPGKAKPKPVSEYKIVGQPIPREDIASKVFAQEDYVTDIKVPGMMHARLIRPPVAGSVPVKVDESLVGHIPGIKVVWQQGLLAVLAEKEWDAIKASEKLKVEWSDTKPPFPPRPNFTTIFATHQSPNVRWTEIPGT